LTRKTIERASITDGILGQDQRDFVFHQSACVVVILIFRGSNSIAGKNELSCDLWRIRSPRSWNEIFGKGQ
jgi:hypothetical protein